MFKISTLTLALFVTGHAYSNELFQDPITTPASELNMDEELALIAKQIPGFAGFSVDAKGQTTVRLARAGLSAKALTQSESALTQYFGKHQTLEADYSYEQLFQWKIAATQLLGEFSQAQSVDLDEVRNRIVVGVLPSQTHSVIKALRSRAETLGIPASAIEFEGVSQVMQQAVLGDRLRPVAAGAQVVIDMGADSIFCSIGANVKRNGVVGFVTAGHCAKTFTPANGLNIFQPITPASSNRAGKIAAMGPLLTNSNDRKCPVGDKCKYGDAMFVAYDTASTASLGKVYITGGYQNLTITATRTIKAVESTPAAGRPVFVTGRTNGTIKAGNVAQTCLVIKGSLDGGVQSLCVNRLNKVSGQTTSPGDSGGTVYATNADGTVNLVGIVFGSSQDFIVYTPWSEVQKQLGTLQLF